MGSVLLGVIVHLGTREPIRTAAGRGGREVGWCAATRMRHEAELRLWAPSSAVHPPPVSADERSALRAVSTLDG